MTVSMATAVVIVNPDGPWRDYDLALFFVVALTVAGRAGGFSEAHVIGLV
jgi:hypothetical protein